MAKAKKETAAVGYNITKSNGKAIYRTAAQMTDEIKKTYESKGWKVAAVEE